MYDMLQGVSTSVQTKCVCVCIMYRKANYFTRFVLLEIRNKE